MKESFIFYKSFYDAINLLGEKSQLKLYKSIMKLNFNWCANETEMLQLCDEIETDLKQNRHVYGTFLLIKPQIMANFTKYLNGQKGKQYGTLGSDYGKLGGRPKKPPKNPPNENVFNVNVNENVFNEVGGIQEKKTDPFINPIKTFFCEEYEKVFKVKPFLSATDCARLIELAADNKDIKEVIPEAVKRLKSIEFEGINFKPSASWLLKDNNFERVMNGEFGGNETNEKSTEDILEEIRQKRLKEGKGDF